MRLDEYVKYDGLGLVDLLAKGEVTPQELGACVSDAVAAVNPALNAVVELYPDALEGLGTAPAEGPFHGLPTLTKDFPVENGRPAEFGSKLTKGFRAHRDEVYWTRLRKAGVVNVGRTTTSEFGVAAATENPLYGATGNPWDPRKGVSGSSGGAAAAIASGIVPFAQGGDAGGSIRNPAAFCGVIGLKPSRGRVTGAPGANAPLLGLATAFMLTRSVRDTAALLDACHGPESGDGYEISQPDMPFAEAMLQTPKGLRIAICTQSWSDTPCDPEIAESVKQTGLLLESMGHHVVEAMPQFDYAAFLAAQKLIWGASSASSMPELSALTGLPLTPETIGGSVMAVYEFGKSVTGAQLFSALEVYDSITRQLGRFTAEYDVLLTPTCGMLPETLGTFDPSRQGLDIDAVFQDMELKETFTAVFNGTGQPAISLPTGKSRSGLPIGSQMVASFGREGLLLAVAKQLEDHFAQGKTNASHGIWGQGLPPVFAANKEVD